MTGLVGVSRSRRCLVTLLLVFVGALAFSVSGALADAGNPILGTIKATAKDNGDGTVTIYVRGQWNWLSHNSDCNFDRAATGAGIIWNDPTEPGYTVSKNGISADVGISSLRAGDATNTVDQMVHPVDRGNQVEGYTTAGTDYPLTQQFVDPSPPGITAAQVAAWKGGCGRQPLTATASKGDPFGEATGLSCANGLVTCADHPWGSWGYEKTNGAGKPRGYSHTYLKTALPSKVCVNFYDVHGGGTENNAKFQVPNGTGEITVDGNGDNSIETNAFNVNNGANCISVLNTTTTTDIHNATHTVVTTAEAGVSVHDFVSVAAVGSNTVPTGTVNIEWFTNGTCTTPAADSSGPVALTNGQVDATGFVKGPLAAGLYGFKAHYLGDNNFMLPSDGACEPLRVVDAKISITPASATNRIGTNHVLTGHVEINDGTGWANAPSGTSINFTTNFGSFTTSNPCTTVGATGSCTITLTSSATGVSTVNASTSVLVFGVSLTRSTNGQAFNSGPATKTWVDAKIAISPLTATNRVGDPHTFTVTLMKDLGDGNGFVAAANEHVDFTLTDSFGASHSAATGTCTGAGANTNASGQCTITFTSNSTGKVTAHASSTLSLGSPATSVHVETDGVAPNSGNGVKTFVNAKISIAPTPATNRVGDPHTFTVTLMKDLGDGGGFVAAGGEHVDVTLTDSNGATHSAPTGSCTTAGPNTNGSGQCSITFTSN
jgi:hypothetical protein